MKLSENLNRIVNEALDPEFEELKEKVCELTSDNFHTEALLTIANYYNLEEFISYLTELKELQESPKYQGITIEETGERLEVQRKIFDILKDQIGIEKAKELYRCL